MNLEFPHIMFVRSSAGSGKTHNLALRYLQLLLLNESEDQEIKHKMQNILAVTFTNKAASEMRKRIIEFMKRCILDLPIREKSETQMIDALRKLIIDKLEVKTVTLTNGEIKTRILRIFEHELLKNFDSFSVTTIDSFINLVLRSSSFNLNIPPDFEITLNSRTYIDFISQKLMQELYHAVTSDGTEGDKDIKKIFDEFIKNYINMEGDKLKWSPRNIIHENMIKFWNVENRTGKIISPIDYSNNINTINNLEKEIETKIKRLLQKIELAIEALPKLKIKKGFTTQLGRALNNEKLEMAFRLQGKFDKSFTEGELLNKGSLPIPDEIENLWNNIREKITTLIEIISLEKLKYYAKLYERFKDVLVKEVTHKMGMVLIDELNNLMQKLLTQEMLSEIWYTLSERYFHFLIDEFQDTSDIQWKNMEPLVDNATSSGGTAFLVGDKKQAIYGWRGGNAGLIDTIKQKKKKLLGNIYDIDLAANYRSNKHIVEFNNLVFDSENIINGLSRYIPENLSNETVQHISQFYTDSSQKLYWKSPGYVHIERFETKSKDKEIDSACEELIHKRFMELLSQVRDSNLYNDSEIAILTRTNEEVNTVVKLLLDSRINVESEYTVSIKHNAIVREIINFLSFLNSPVDNLSFASFITGIIFQKVTGLQKDQVFAWLTKIRLRNLEQKKTHSPLYREFQKWNKGVWDEYFSPFFRNVGYMPLYELVCLILKKWTLFQGFPDYYPYLFHLLEIIKKFESGGENNLVSFLDFWNNESGDDEYNKEFLLKSTEGADAIHVTTIHKAKGLEFKVVFFPLLKGKIKYDHKLFTEEENLTPYYITEKYCPFSEKLRQLYFDKRTKILSEEINNFYVALTRSRNELYVLTKFIPPKLESKNTVKYYFKRYNILADLIFENEDLKKFIQNDKLIMGKRPAPKHKAKIKDLPQEDLFDDLSDKLDWLEFLKTKVEEPSEVTKENIHAIYRGEAIHYILSLIEQMPEQGIEKFLKEKIGIGLYKYPLLDIDDAYKSLNRIFQNTKIKNFFLIEKNDKVFNEMEIVNENGDLYRVDRLIIRKEQIEIIDFKTGAYNKKHTKQILNYKKLISQIYDKKINTYLIYLDENKVLEVAL